MRFVQLRFYLSYSAINCWTSHSAHAIFLERSLRNENNHIQAMENHKQEKTIEKNSLLSRQRSKKTVEYNSIAEINVNELFPHDDITDKDQLGEINESPTQEKTKQVSASSSSSVSETEILSLIAMMAAKIAYLTDKVKSLTEQLNGMGKNSVLKFDVDRNSTKEEDLPLLQKSDIFQLPITEHAQLEKLENELNTDRLFKIFFVSQI